MHDDRSDEQEASDKRDLGSGPEKVFRILKTRPTDELDSGALWRRIEGDLEPRAASWIDRVAAAIGLGGLQPATLRLAGVGAVAILLVAVVWLAPGLSGPEVPATPGDDLLADGGAAANGAGPMPVNTQPAWILDVRLVRGYSGELPADAMASAGAGAGGADRLADLRGALDGLMPFGEFALVGQWQGALDATDGAAGSEAMIARLSDSFELRFAAESAGTGVNLADVFLDGAGRPLVADELALTPGRPYLFGVQAEGEDSDTGSLVLAVRLLPAGADADVGGEGVPTDPSDPTGNSPDQR